jgi:hypothetical protein
MVDPCPQQRVTCGESIVPALRRSVPTARSWTRAPAGHGIATATTILTSQRYFRTLHSRRKSRSRTSGLIRASLSNLHRVDSYSLHLPEAWRVPSRNGVTGSEPIGYLSPGKAGSERPCPWRSRLTSCRLQVCPSPNLHRTEPGLDCVVRWHPAPTVRGGTRRLVRYQSPASHR